MTGSMFGVTEELREEWLRLGSATLYEASRLECWLPPTLRPLWSGSAVVGPALPVRVHPGDNLALHMALEVVRPGEVIVADGGSAPHGYWGEVLTVAAMTAGVAGLVLDGGVRDSDSIEMLRFPVFSSAIALRGTAKVNPGAVGEPIMLGPTTIRRGDLVVGDRDGVVVVPAGLVGQLLEASRARVAKEAAFLEEIREGALTLDLYDLRRKPSSSL